MNDVNINVDNALLVERRIAEACKGLKPGSPELKIKMNKVLTELFNDGVLIKPHEWVDSFNINIFPAGDIGQINIKCDFH